MKRLLRALRRRFETPVVTINILGAENLSEGDLRLIGDTVVRLLKEEGMF